MFKSLIILTSMLLCVASQAQDERLFRKMLTGELTRPESQREKVSYHYKARTPTFQFDMNDDGKPEAFFFAKKDGEDWIFINGQDGNRLYKYKFEAKGVRSRPFRIQARSLGKKSTLFVISYYEGYTSYLDFKGTARYYFLTVDNNDLKTMSMYKGPYFWDEVKDFRNHYHNRKHELSLIDFDKDGFNDVAVRFNLITRVFLYRNDGNWKTGDRKKVLFPTYN